MCVKAESGMKCVHVQMQTIHDFCWPSPCARVPGVWPFRVTVHAFLAAGARDLSQIHIAI